MVVADNGSNTWINEPAVHAFLREAQSPAIVEHLINTLMMHQPVKK
jgi:hypothetical protein